MLIVANDDLGEHLWTTILVQGYRKVLVAMISSNPL
jgi:hypothetical protein